MPNEGANGDCNRERVYFSWNVQPLVNWPCSSEGHTSKGIYTVSIVLDELNLKKSERVHKLNKKGMDNASEKCRDSNMIKTHCKKSSKNL